MPHRFRPPPPNSCCRRWPLDSACPRPRCVRPTRTRYCACRRRYVSRRATPSTRVTISSPTVLRTGPLFSRGSRTRPASRPPGYCPYIGAMTTADGLRPIGSCGGAGSCCSTVTPRPGSGCRWTRSAGDRRVSGSTPIRWRPTASSLSIRMGPRRLSRTPTRRPPRLSSPRSETVCCSYSCRRPTPRMISST